MSNDFITFMHVSDIHFQKRSGEVLDLDLELRTQLEHDAQKMKNEIGEVLGILVTGDIGYSGQSEEYKKAIEWLVHLCEVLDCTKQNVWVVPGNHDVHRASVQNSKPLKDQYKLFRTVNVVDLDKEIESTIGDQTYSKILFDPISNYIEFASKFSCDIQPSKPFWESDFTLNEGSTLRLRGLNSTIISDQNDNEEENKLILGGHQVMFLQEDGVAYLTLCHHPPDWLRDRDNVMNAMNVGTSVQLFGHKHNQHILHVTDNDRIDTLHMVAGAVHPERTGSDWKPRYNFLSLSVKGTGNSRELCATVYPRVWKNETRSFDADLTSDEQPSQSFLLRLPTWDGASVNSQLQDAYSEVESSKICPPENIPSEAEVALYSGEFTMDTSRKLTYHFLKLPYHKIMKVAGQLNVLTDKDNGLKDFELYKRIFQRATKKELLADLWDAVDKEYDNNALGENPYRKSKV